MKDPRTLPPREALAVMDAFVRYIATVIPLARRELRRWEARARQIPDATLRGHALRKLSDEHLNPEAAGVFSILVAPQRIAAVVRLTVAFQVLYDYLDALGEQPVPDQLRNGRQLHRALPDAVALRTPRDDYYRYHPQQDDGGYIRDLIATCHHALATLPAARTVSPVAVAAARRCAEGQTRTNAAPAAGHAQLERWARTELRDDGFHWWELAAGAAANLSVHAVLAAAGEPRTTTSDAVAIDHAYHPAICALTTFLDSVIDDARDRHDADHRYLSYYRTQQEMADRIATIAARAVTGSRQLRHGSRHAVLVAGIAAYYLSAPEATTALAQPVAQRVIAALGPIATVPLAVMRLRRRAH